MMLGWCGGRRSLDTVADGRGSSVCITDVLLGSLLDPW